MRYNNKVHLTIRILTLVVLCIVLYVAGKSMLIYGLENKDKKPSSVVLNLEDQLNHIDQQQRTAVKLALRQTFALFTMKDLINVKLIDRFNNHKDYTEIDSIVEVRLKDGNSLIIGYFENNGVYRSLLK